LSNDILVYRRLVDPTKPVLMANSLRNATLSTEE
jgi:hypothetical protein